MPVSMSILPLVPVHPIMGGMFQTSKDEFTRWTGGKPNIGWTALDPSAPAMFWSLNQQHALYSKSATDGYNLFCTTGWSY
jgi:hypothetical protein